MTTESLQNVLQGLATERRGRCGGSNGCADKTEEYKDLEVFWHLVAYEVQLDAFKGSHDKLRLRVKHSNVSIQSGHPTSSPNYGIPNCTSFVQQSSLHWLNKYMAAQRCLQTAQSPGPAFWSLQRFAKIDYIVGWQRFSWFQTIVEELSKLHSYKPWMLLRFDQFNNQQTNQACYISCAHTLISENRQQLCYFPFKYAAGPDF